LRLYVGGFAGARPGESSHDVARRIESDPVVLLAAGRDGYSSALTDARLPEHRLAALDAAAAELPDAAAPDLPLAARNRVLREAAGNPLALLELPAVAVLSEDEPSVPGGLPLTERLERAFAARVAELPDATRLVLLVAALSDADAGAASPAAYCLRLKGRVRVRTSSPLTGARAACGRALTSVR
jgi:hypothetical protein